MRTGAQLKILWQAASLLALLIPGAHHALAATSTSNFTTQMTITAECRIISVTNINFGSTGIIATNVDVDGSLLVQCTNSTPYTLSMSAGAGTGATVATRLMTGSNPATTATITYSLYRDASRTQAWGVTDGTDTVPGTGTGSNQTIPVYGRVPPQSTPAPGVYSDTVLVTLTY